MVLTTLFINDKESFKPLFFVMSVKVTEENYWLYFFYQILVVYFAGSIASIVGCFYCGAVTEICLQLDILRTRLREMPSGVEEKVIIEHLKHHEMIYELGENFSRHFWNIDLIFIWKQINEGYE